MLESLVEWTGNLPWSIALRESYYVWPMTESAHVLTLGLFVGTAFVTGDLEIVTITFELQQKVSMRNCNRPAKLCRH